MGVKSTVFTMYNRLKQWGRLNPILLDVNRLNRALGICNSPHGLMVEDEYMYSSTVDDCHCPDMQYYNSRRRKGAGGEQYRGPCKHILAHRMIAGIALD